MKEGKAYRVLLYYLYTPIEDHENYAEMHLRFCKAIGVLGRIIIAPEGINGTISGTPQQCEAYMAAMHSDPRFATMVFKIDEADQNAFRKIFVRPKSELVMFHLDHDVDPNELSGKRLAPRDFYEAMQGEDTIIIDARNDYEYDLGHFRNAIRPEVQSFREFPAWVRNNLAEHKHKKVLAYCTGGIRCEKFTGFLIKEGFQDVAQLRGGIVTYGKDPEVQGRDFDGSLYVFDDRIAMPVNHTDNARSISSCKRCGTECDRYVNCANPDCHDQHFLCDSCRETYHGTCSQECQDILDAAKSE